MKKRWELWRNLRKTATFDTISILVIIFDPLNIVKLFLKYLIVTKFSIFEFGTKKSLIERDRCAPVDPRERQTCAVRTSFNERKYIEVANRKTVFDCFV